MKHILMGLKFVFFGVFLVVCAIFLVSAVSVIMAFCGNFVGIGVCVALVLFGFGFNSYAGG